MCNYEVNSDIEAVFCSQGGGSNEYPQSMFWAEMWENIRVFYLKGRHVQTSFLYHYKNTPIQVYRQFHLQNLKMFR